MKRTLQIWKMQWKNNNDIKSYNSFQLCKTTLNSFIRTRCILISQANKRRKKCVKVFDNINFFFVHEDTRPHSHLLVFIGI